MKIIYLKTLFLFIFLVGAGEIYAELPAPEETLSLCQNKVVQRRKALGIQFQRGAPLDKLNSCVSRLVELQNPYHLSKEGVAIEEFDCGFWCNVGANPKINFFNWTSGKEDYVELIKASLTKEEIENYKKHFPGGVEKVISDSYDKTEAWYLRDDLSSLKMVIGDFAESYFVSEMLALRLKNSESFSVEKRAKEYRKNLDKCFEKARNPDQVQYCLDQMSIYAAADLGPFVLSQNLEQHLLVEIDRGHHKAIKSSVRDEYNECTVKYLFNDKNASKPVEKTKSCVYSALMIGFKQIARVSVVSELENLKLNNPEQIEALVSQALNACEKSDVINPVARDEKYYKHISSETPESIEKMARQCKVTVENSLVARVATLAIESHEDIRKVVGSGVQAFARSVVDNHLETCVDRLKKDSPQASARHCGNYLMTASVFEIVDQHAESHIDKILQKVGGIELSEEEKRTYIKETKESMNQCRKDTFNSMIKNYSMSYDKADVEITNCLKVGVLTFAEKLAQKSFVQKIKENEIVKQYNVDIGEQKMDEILGGFHSCLKTYMDKLPTVGVLMSGLSTAIGDCQLPATKSAVLYVLDQVLIQELQAAGLTRSQVDGVISTYKKRDKNLFKDIENAKTSKEIDRLTEAGDYEVIKAIAYNVIYLLIRKDTKGYLSRSQTKGYAKTASSDVIACAATNSLSVCQDRATPKIMESIFIATLPGEVEKQIIAEAKGLLSAGQVKGFIGVKSNFAWWIRKNSKKHAHGFETNTGHRLISLMVKEKVRGKSLAEVQALPKVRQEIATILVDSPKTFGRFIESIVQPKLSAEEVRTRHFLRFFVVSKSAFNWNNIKSTSNGKATIEAIKEIFRSMIVNNRRFNKSDEARVKSLVDKAVREYGHGPRKNGKRSKTVVQEHDR